MPHHSRLSSKGQITIPSEVREKLGLEPGDVVVYEIEGDRVVLHRAEPLDLVFHAALNPTLEEWASREDEEAFGEL